MLAQKPLILLAAKVSQKLPVSERSPKSFARLSGTDPFEHRLCRVRYSPDNSLKILNGAAFNAGLYLLFGIGLLVLLGYLLGKHCLLVYYFCMAIFGLLGGSKKSKGGKKATPAKVNKSAKKKAKTCEFC